MSKHELDWARKLNVMMGARSEDLLSTDEAVGAMHRVAFRIPLGADVTLCTRCNLMLIILLNAYSNFQKPLGIPPNRALYHYWYWIGLVQSAKDGCMICRSIYRKYWFQVNTYPQFSDASEDDERFTVFHSSISVHDPQRPVCTAFIEVYNSTRAIQGYNRLEMTASLRMDSASAPELPLDIHLETKSRHDKVALVADWIQTCVASHQGRCTITSRFIPTRLLRLRRNENGGQTRTISVKLHETASQDNIMIDRYLTLTYRWGENDMIRLTQGRLEEMLQEISFDALPILFQEVVEFALNLMGEEAWLWVDALCIIQDSEDWLREAAQMGQIYANSYLNIGAMASSGPQRSLWFQPEEQRTYLTPEFRVEVDGSWHTTVWPSAPDMVEIDMSPLNQRAWVTQERILSPRMVHFGTSQLYWECDELKAGETYPRGLLYAAGRSRPFKTVLARAQGSEGDQNARAFKEWGDFIFRYTECDITRPSDRLPAMAAIAKVFKDKYKDEYFAGIWKRHLPQGLLWRPWPKRREQTSCYQDYVAPSWSWASIQGGVAFPFGWSDDRYIVGSVEEIHVKKNPHMPLGPVYSGHVIARGRLAGAYWWLPRFNDKYPMLGFWSGSREEVYGIPSSRVLCDDNKLVRIQPDMSSNVEWRAAPEEQLAVYNDHSLFCFPIVLPRSTNDGLVTEPKAGPGEAKFKPARGLILQKIVPPDFSIPHPTKCFRRVGYFEIYQELCLKHLLGPEETTFTII